MNAYLFIHGKQASLSKYELDCVFGVDSVKHGTGFSLVDSAQVVDQRVQNRMGGTVKIARVFEADPVEVLTEEFPTGKILFGLSVYGGTAVLTRPLAELKEQLEARGRNARYVNKDTENVSSGLLNRSRLLEKGVDLVLCRFDDREVWGRTVTFQDIDSYSLRDFDRPVRDAKVGMLPPKLAQMMINFSRPGDDEIILDPFCGLGTIPMEAVLAGRNVIGLDLKGRMIEATQSNLSWTCKTFGVERKLVGDVRQHDATTSFHLPSRDFQCVTEGYLGPPLERFPSPEKQSEIFTLLDKIYRPFFQHISNAMMPGRKIVFSFPFFQRGSRQVLFPADLMKKYLTSGFKVINDSGRLLYSRHDQVVGRDIVVWEKC